VTSNDVSVTGSGTIDELRLYPVKAQMTTFSYKPLIGVGSQSDPNNRVTYYEYDWLGRLKLIRDQDRKILKTLDYQFQVTP
jgi:YD repeat-containing protein